MAYVLGYFYADGGMENSPTIRGQYIRFSSKDKQLLNNVKQLMSAEHPLVQRKVQSTQLNYLLRIGDKKLYSDLTRIGLCPNKSLTVVLPQIPVKYFPDFLRGYFDGDGCVYLERQKLKNGRRSIKRLHTSFTSGSHVFLEGLGKEIYKHTKIESKLYLNGSCFQLRYSTDSSVKLFRCMYENTDKGKRLSRKFKRFQEFFSERESWIDSSIQSILCPTE